MRAEKFFRLGFSTKVSIAGKTGAEFYQEVQRQAERAKGEKVVFAEGESKFHCAAVILGALIAGTPVVPVAEEYGAERIRKIKAVLGKARIPRGVAAILFTSGTNGEPKGVMLSLHALMRNIRDIRSYMGDVKRRILIFRPLAHSAVFTGELLYAIASGWDIEFWNGRFLPAEITTFMKEKAIDLAGMTPSMYKAFLRLRCKLPVRELILSGECLGKKDAAHFAETAKFRIYSVYGLTENAPRVSALLPDEFRKRAGSVGKPIGSTKCKIVNGELWVKSPSRMMGYLEQKQATREKFHFGWLKTGDIARVDCDGYFYIVGRKDDMIIRGGVNIYPSEIENAFLQFEGIEECVAYGTEDERYGQKIIVEYVGTIGEKDMFIRAAKVLPAYLIPSVIRKCDSLRKTESGKLKRRIR